MFCDLFARKTFTLIGFSIFPLLAACSGPDQDLDPRPSQTIQAAKFESIDSPTDFENALHETGNAQGHGYAQYKMIIDHTTFAGDCEASFMIAHEFGANSQWSVEEVDELLDKGMGERTATPDVYYRDGQIWFLDFGPDDEDISGPINDDGQFRIVGGEYPRSAYCRFFIYEGQFNREGETFDGVIRSVIHSWDEEPKGSCHAESPFHARMVKNFLPPDPPKR